MVKKFIFALLVAASLLFLVDSKVSAATYYVDNVNGLNTNLGTSTGAAWKTLAFAGGQAVAGDTVYVINNGSLSPFRERLSPTNIGSAGNLISFIGMNGSPILLGTVDYSSGATWTWHLSSHGTNEYYMTNSVGGDPGITAVLPRVLASSLKSAWNLSGVDSLTNRSTGTIGSLTAGQWNYGNNDALAFSTIYYRLATGETDITAEHIEGGEDSATRRNPILENSNYVDIENFKILFSNHHGILNQADNVTYKNIDSSYTGRSGWSSTAAHNHLTVTNSRFDHNGLLGISDTTGIQLGLATGCTITNNVVSNGVADSGINVKNSSNSNLIEYNIIFNNAQHGIDISTSSLNNTIYNNTSYGNGDRGINVESTSTGNVIKNNIMAGNLGYQLSIFDAGSTTGLVLNNNDFYYSDPAANIIRYATVFYSINTFATYKTNTGQDANSLAVNPAFINTSGSFSQVGDFKLSSASPLIDAGVNVGLTADYIGTVVPQGSSPDIGAYEYIFPGSSSSSSNSSPGNYSTSSPNSGCGEAAGPGTPNLFEIRTGNNSATLYFAPPVMPYSNFYIAYSDNPGIWKYGTQYNQAFSPGVLIYTINALQPNTKYNFRIRSGNGCSVGAWGNIMSAVTATSKSYRPYYKNTASNTLPKTKVTAPPDTTGVTTPIQTQTNIPPQTPPAPKTRFCFLWWCF